MKKIIISFVIIIIAFFLAFLLFKYNKRNNGNNTTITKTTVKNNNKVDNKQNKEDIMDGITLNFHASIRMEKNNNIIYFDPYKIEDSKNDANYIFITHSHYDHYDEDSIKKVMNENTKFIVTNDLEDKIISLGVNESNIKIVYPSESFDIDDLKINTVPAYNVNSTYHKKSYNWVGYVVEIKGIKYYIVGDSDVTDEMKKVSCDVMFVPVGGTYTMNYDDAVKIVNEIKPKYAVPIHYGIVGSKEDAKNFIKGLDTSIKGIILN